MKTVLNPEVRLAHEIETERFDFCYLSPSRNPTRFLQSDALPGKFSIRGHIQEELVPGRSMRLKRNNWEFMERVDFSSHM